MIVGRQIKVIGSSDPTLISRSGLVVDETKNLLRIIESGFLISIPKSTSFFEMTYEGRKINISGKELVGTPQERIHKLGN